jgi:hypothetical protein
MVLNKKNVREYAGPLSLDNDGIQQVIDIMNKPLSNYLNTDSQCNGYGYETEHNTHISFLIYRKLKDFDRALNAFGVETCEMSKLDGDDKYLSYCNVADVYNYTIYHFQGKFRIGCIGDEIEKYD